MTAPGLLLLAHGSPDPRHAAAMDRLAAAVGVRHGAPTALAFLEHDAPAAPQAAQQLAAAGVRWIRVVPLLLAAGFHDGTDVPRVAATVRHLTGIPTDVAAPLGPDPLLAESVLQRVADEAPATALVVAHSGAPDSPAAHVAADTARSIGAAVAHGPAAVADAVRRWGAAADVVVVRLLLADGVLSDRISAAAAAVGARSVGRLADAPAMAGLVLRRAATAP